MFWQQQITEIKAIDTSWELLILIKKQQQNLENSKHPNAQYTSDLSSVQLI